MELLKFKKSVFAGALDQDGEDVVMIGESQMKRFMNTVETVTEKIEKSDPLGNSRPKEKPSGTRPWRIGPSNWKGIRKLRERRRVS